MRTLDQEEKLFLTEIVRHFNEGNLPCLADLVDDDLVDKNIKIDFQSRTAEIYFDEKITWNVTNYLPNTVKQISYKLMKFVNLLKYLQEQGYLYLWQEATENQTERFHGRLVDGTPSIKQRVSDKFIEELLVDYLFRNIVIGQTLVDYVHNNFQTTEDLQFNANIKIASDSLETARQSVNQANESLKISQKSLDKAEKSVYLSKIAIWGSVIMTTITILSSSYLVKYQTEKPITIDSIQIDRLVNSLKDIEIKMDTIENRIKNLKPVRYIKKK